MNLSKQSGFTLIELISVLAIISILAAMSYPSYTNYVIKARRSQAPIALEDLAGGMERYYIDHNSYVGATLGNTDSSEYTENNYYQLQIVTATENDFLVTATPKNSQIEDQACGTFSLDQLGERMISGNGQIEDCW